MAVNPQIRKQKEINRMMKEQLADLELKARFWKAQFEIRHYSIQSANLEDEYHKYLQNEEKKKELLIEENAKKIKEQMELEAAKKQDVPEVNTEVNQ